MYIAVGYFNSFPSTKTTKSYKLSANPSVCYRLKTFWKDKNEIVEFSSISTSPFPVTLAWQAQLTNIGRKCYQPLKQKNKTKQKQKQNKKNRSSAVNIRKMKINF